MIAASSALRPDAAPDSIIRVLRWTFRRDDEEIVCELGLTADHSAYQLRIALPWNPGAGPFELFDDAVSAFQRQATIERRWLEEGWTLEQFESRRVVSGFAPAAGHRSPAPR